MTQKTALILSAVLTAFVLVLGGGLVAQVSQSAAAPVAAPAAASTTAPAASVPAAHVTAQLQQIMQQREAQYRQLIEQANQRLAAMNQQLAAAQVTQSAPAKSAQAVLTTRAAQPSQPAITLSAETARNIAIAASNYATMIREPELVRFEGQVAYEVGLTRGVVYVDANTGAVLYNGTQHGNGGGQPATQPPVSSGDPEHENHDGEHDD